MTRRACWCGVGLRPTSSFGSYSVWRVGAQIKFTCRNLLSSLQITMCTRSSCISTVMVRLLRCALGIYCKLHKYLHLSSLTYIVISILSPGVVHAVYTPVLSFATGGRLNHHSCMHLTKLSHYIDAEVRASATNQVVNHALKTLRHMVIRLPYLSPRINLYSSSWYSDCHLCFNSASQTLALSPHHDGHQGSTILCAG
jgi:hypothetical protein